MSEKLHRVRNHIGNEGVAKNRREIFKSVISRYNEALKNGYYLEAIALCESLITDRMESRIGELTNEDVSFNTIGNLREKLNGKIDQYDSIEFDDKLISLYNKIVRGWAGQRNKALHQAAKISQKESKSFNAFNEEAKQTAVDGLKLFRELDAQLKKVRREKD